MSDSNFIAILKCPECKEPLAADEQPHIDWKRGQTRLSIEPTQDSVEHLFACLGFVAIDLDETARKAAEDAAKQAESNADEDKDQPEADQASVKPEESEKNPEPSKVAPKTALSKAKTSK